MNKLKQTVVIAGLLLLAGTTFAQIDDRARELLDGLVQEQSITDIRTMEQVMTMYIADQDISTATRTIIDYDNERAVIFTEAMGTEVMMRYMNGSMTMFMQGMSLPMPPGLDDTFDGIFDDATYEGLLDQEGVTASYDGVVSYADVLSGHQVTYSADEASVAAAQAADLGGASEVRFIFDDAGNLIGNVVDMGDATDLVSVFVGEPLLEGLPVFDSEMYQLQDGTATLFGTMTYETISVNEPVDESLFQ